MKKYPNFYLKTFCILVVKFSIYLNRHVFVRTRWNSNTVFSNNLVRIERQRQEVNIWNCAPSEYSYPPANPCSLFEVFVFHMKKRRIHCSQKCVKTTWRSRLVWIFRGRTCPKEGYLTLPLSYKWRLSSTKCHSVSEAFVQSCDEIRIILDLSNFMLNLRKE